jgi:hypothetical protein
VRGAELRLLHRSLIGNGFGDNGFHFRWLGLSENGRVKKDETSGKGLFEHA